MIFLRVGIIKIGTTNRACLMISEPEIDAFLVEHVAAHSEEAKKTLILEFQQANRAFQAVPFAFAMKFLHGRIGKRGEYLKQRLLEASVG